MKIVSVDIETSGLSYLDSVLCIGCAVSQGDQPLQTSAIWLGPGNLFAAPVSIPEARAWLQAVIADADWLVLHNASFDLPYLFRLGVLTPDEARGRVFDTLVMAATTGSHASKSLAALCREYGIDGGLGWQETKEARGNMARLDPQSVMDYCQQDCLATLRLFHRLNALADQEGYDRAWIAREGDYCILLSRMRQRGIPLNLPWITQRLEDNAVKRRDLAGRLTQAGIGGPNDRTGLTAWLRQRFQPGDLPSTDSGQVAQDEEALTGLLPRLGQEDGAVLRSVLDLRGIEKEDGTYLKGFLSEADDSGRVHPSFFNGGTRTWRLSSSHPAAQTIPRGDLQSNLFRASQPGGALLALDYSQAQLRLAAMYAREEQMAAAFANPGTDIHTATAIALFGPEEGPRRRTEGKSANFSVLFGSGAAGVAATYHLDITVADQILAKHKAAFPLLTEGARSAVERWRKRRYLILPYGKRTYATPEDLQSRAFVAWNYLIQGAEGAIMQEAMLRIDAAGLTIVNQVHDALYIDIGPDQDAAEIARQVGEHMEQALPTELSNRTKPPIRMPVDVKIIRREI